MISVSPPPENKTNKFLQLTVLTEGKKNIIPRKIEGFYVTSFSERTR